MPIYVRIFGKNQGRAAALPCPMGSFAPGVVRARLGLGPGLAPWRSSAATGLGPRVLRTSWGFASYGGGVNPGPVADAGLGVEGGAFHSDLHGWCAVRQRVCNASGHGCRGGGPGWRSACLALRRASLRRWWLCFFVVWAARGIALGSSGSSSAMVGVTPRSGPEGFVFVATIQGA